MAFSMCRDRRSKPEMERGFRVPFVPVLPALGGARCVYLMTKLPFDTWLRFFAWLFLGLVIYAVTATGTRVSGVRPSQRLAFGG